MDAAVVIGSCESLLLNQAQCSLSGQTCCSDWKLAQPFTSRVKYCIGDSWSNGGDRVFAEPTGTRRAGHNVGLNRRHFVHAHYAKVAVSSLLNATVTKIDLAVQSRRESPSDAAFNLSFDSQRIDRQSAVDDAKDSLYANVTQAFRH